MAKYQATYRAASTLPDEYVEQLKADVKSVGSFSDFVNDLYKKSKDNPVKETEQQASQPSVVVDVETPLTSSLDTNEIIAAIQQSKQEIMAEIANIASAPAPAPVSAPAPVAAPTPVPVPDMSNLLTHDAMSAHKADILREIAASREAELARLDKVLEAIENLLPEPGDGNVMLTAEPKDIRTDEETPETLAPVELMGEEEMSSFMDSLVDEVYDPEEEEQDTEFDVEDFAEVVAIEEEDVEDAPVVEAPVEDMLSEDAEEDVLTPDDLDYEAMLGLEELFGEE